MLSRALVRPLSALTRLPRTSFPTRSKGTQSKAGQVQQTLVEVDEDCIPVKPSYSMAAFLDSLPRPEISDEHYIHLHKLAALSPPAPGSDEFRIKKEQLQEMLRLVEGVRQARRETDQEDLPDGRIWPDEQGIDLEWDRDTAAHIAKSKDQIGGRRLLELAEKKHLAGYYTVKRKQRGDAE